MMMVKKKLFSLESLFFSKGGFIGVVGRVCAPKQLLHLTLILCDLVFHMRLVFCYVAFSKERHFSHLLTLSYFRVAYYD